MPDATDRGDEARAHTLAAAGQAAEALAALLRFAGEGRTLRDGIFDAEVVELLLDAAKLTIEFETAEEVAEDPEGERSQLYGAICRILEGCT